MIDANMPNCGHIEITYIDNNRQARKTGLGASGTTWAETKECFGPAQQRRCPVEDADFLCDLYDPSGDIIDTVGLKREDVEFITNEPTKTNDEYIRLDKQFWDRAESSKRACRKPA